MESVWKAVVEEGDQRERESGDNSGVQFAKSLLIQYLIDISKIFKSLLSISISRKVIRQRKCVTTSKVSIFSVRQVNMHSLLHKSSIKI